jgi:murein DD-endopeptidase MepM/ murein hydrolase activator NlpD
MSHPQSPSHARAAHSSGHSRPQTAAAVSRTLHRPRGGDYTLAHAGRQVRIGPIAFWIVVGTLVIMAAWTIGTGTYFAFRESVLTGLMGRQAEMQTAYEDRIAELRAQVDRITSRQLLDQDQFEQKLDALLKRQALLERRTAELSGEALTTGSIRRHRAEEPAPRAKASPISNTVIFHAPPDREARLESREIAPVANTRSLAEVRNRGLDGVLARVVHSLDKIEKRQDKVVAETEEKVDSKMRRMRSVLADLGVDTGRVRLRGVGGPFVPVKAPSASASNFERALYRINVGRAEVDHLSQVLGTVPLRKPVAGEVDMSSTFGVRMDPFLHRPAMHTGLDLRGDTGDPVHVTASGKVSMAGRDGGYGNMVEVQHGNGLATRYGHLSEIDVKVGQYVRIGEVIGKIGSTGRSTGPHLHYETRVAGEAVDPQKFLRAGVRLGGLL